MIYTSPQLHILCGNLHQVGVPALAFQGSSGGESSSSSQDLSDEELDKKHLKVSFGFINYVVLLFAQSLVVWCIAVVNIQKVTGCK